MSSSSDRNRLWARDWRPSDLAYNWGNHLSHHPFMGVVRFLALFFILVRAWLHWILIWCRLTRPQAMWGFGIISSYRMPLNGSCALKIGEPYGSILDSLLFGLKLKALRAIQESRCWRMLSRSGDGIQLAHFRCVGGDLYHSIWVFHDHRISFNLYGGRGGSLVEMGGMMMLSRCWGLLWGIYLRKCLFPTSSTFCPMLHD